jgi:hypothetical protein
VGDQKMQFGNILNVIYPSKHPGHFGAKCKACNCKWGNGTVNKLQVHLAHECEYIKEEIKKDICILFQKEMV